MLERDSRAAGFTLVEALVALAIIASGAMTLAALALQVTDTVSRGRQRAVAAFLADAAIAERIGGGVAATSTACLLQDIGGCGEFRNARGDVVLEPAAAFAIRWHAAPLAGAPAPASVITVCAVANRLRAPAARPAGTCAARVVMEPRP